MSAPCRLQRTARPGHAPKRQRRRRRRRRRRRWRRHRRNAAHAAPALRTTRIRHRARAADATRNTPHAACRLGGSGAAAGASRVTARDAETLQRSGRPPRAAWPARTRRRVASAGCARTCRALWELAGRPPSPSLLSSAAKRRRPLVGRQGQSAVATTRASSPSRLLRPAAAASPTLGSDAVLSQRALKARAACHRHACVPLNCAWSGFCLDVARSGALPHALGAPGRTRGFRSTGPSRQTVGMPGCPPRHPTQDSAEAAPAASAGCLPPLYRDPPARASSWAGSARSNWASSPCSGRAQSALFRFQLARFCRDLEA